MSLRSFRRSAIGLAVAALAASQLLRPRLPSLAPGLLLVLLAAGLVAADLRPVRTGPHRKASLGTAPAVAAALLFEPGLAGPVLGLAALASNRLLGRGWENALFNAAQVSLATLAASSLGADLVSVGPLPVGRALLAGALFAAVSYTVSGTALARLRGVPVREAILDGVRASWVQMLALAATGVLLAVLLRLAPWSAILAMAFLPLVYRMNRALENQLEANERLAGVLASQRRFLTDVSHHVGNPLATIRTNLGLLRPGALPPAEARALRDAATEAARLAELWRRLRLLAETDEGVPLKLQVVDLVEVANDLLRAFAFEAEQQGVDLRSSAIGPVSVRVDVDLLRQAAAGLVENAIRHSPRGHAVRLRVAREHGESVIEVLDEGPGIEPHRLDTIFQRFEKGPEGGSGLGLAIAKNVVERHGGRIGVQSSTTGSRFTISLPEGGVVGT